MITPPTIAYGDYRIHLITIDTRIVDGVHYAPDGAWIGTILEEHVDEVSVYQWVKPLVVAGSRVHARDSWWKRIVKYLGPLDV